MLPERGNGRVYGVMSLVGTSPTKSMPAFMSALLNNRHTIAAHQTALCANSDKIVVQQIERLLCGGPPSSFSVRSIASPAASSIGFPHGVHPINRRQRNYSEKYEDKQESIIHGSHRPFNHEKHEKPDYVDTDYEN